MPDRFRGVKFAGIAAPPRHPAAHAARERSSGPAAVAARCATRPELVFPPEQVEFVSLALSRAGMNPAEYRIAPLVRRIPACLRALRQDSLKEASRVVASCQNAAVMAVNSLLIGTTSFFRDPQVFRALENEVIPLLVREHEALRVWSAACSDGSELYSVGMLLEECGALEKSALLGTDCRESCVAAGQRGTYLRAIAEHLAPERITRHFMSSGGFLEISPRLRQATSWKLADLTREREPGEFFELILCRNVAIYLDPAPVAALWQRLALSLVPGGFLIVGKAEKIHHPQLRRVAPCTYLKL